MAAEQEAEGQQDRMSSSPAPAQSQLIRTLFVAPFAEKKRALIAMIGALLLLSLTQALLVLLIGPFFKALFSDSTQPTIVLRDLVSVRVSAYFPQIAALEISRIRLAQILPMSILAVALVKGVATYFFQLHQQLLALHLGRRYREKLFAAILTLPYARLIKKSAGEWMSLVMNDVHFIQTRVSDLMTGLMRDGSQVIAALLALYVVHWPTALAITVMAVPLTIGTGRTGKRIAHFAEGWQTELARMSGAVLDLRRRFEFIRSQGGEEVEKQRFWRMNQGYFLMIQRSIGMRSVFAPALEWIGFVGFAIVLVMVREGIFTSIHAGDLFQFFAVLGIMIKPLKSIGEQLSRYHETKGILKQGLATFAAVAQEGADQGPVLAAVRGLSYPIEACELSYKEGFSLRAEAITLKPGLSIAIIGPSGAGKSSLLKVFSGLLPPTVWKSPYSWEELRRDATLVSQKPFLFSGTIRENLLYGHEDGSLARAASDEDLTDALEFVGIRREFHQMGQGLDTALNFMQSSLSGGQLQRLTIARALLRPETYLLMDEVTSAIDPVAEGQITKKLIERARDKRQGLIFVTHRLSQLELFDEVWFCESGKVRVFRDVSSWSTDPRIIAFLQEHQTHS